MTSHVVLRKTIEKEIIEWDIPNWSVTLQYWKQNTNHHGFSSLKALEIGSRHGGLSLWCALNEMNVLCTDLTGPTSEAVEKHSRHKVSHLIKYGALDATNIPYHGEFDIVLFKSVLGGIGRNNNVKNQSQTIKEIHKALKKDGELWFAENLTASPMHQFFRKRYVNWGNRWRYVTTREMVNILSVFSQVRYTTVGFLGTFGRTSFQRDILGKIDRLVLNKIVPESWRYIMIGVARK